MLDQVRYFGVTERIHLESEVELKIACFDENSSVLDSGGLEFPDPLECWGQLLVPIRCSSCELDHS